jgi:chromosome segregation ATPase
VSAPKRPPDDSLASAAAALEAELTALEGLAREAARPPLTSRKALEQSAARLGELATAEERLAPLAHALTAAFGRIAERQRALGASVTARASEITTRRAALATLLERYEGLGRGAADLNVLAREAQTRLADDAAAPSVLDLAAISERVTALVDGAHDLAEAARESQFADLASDAHALEQQLLAMRNRLKLASERGRQGARS